MNTIVRQAQEPDKDVILRLLDAFREDCIQQITRKKQKSLSAQESGSRIYNELLLRGDYVIFVLEDDKEIVGIITGYLCPMLRSGGNRAEVEEFFVKKEYRGAGNAEKLMDAFVNWCKQHSVSKVNLESDNELERAHRFYKKYGFEIKAQRFVKKI